MLGSILQTQANNVLRVRRGENHPPLRDARGCRFPAARGGIAGWYSGIGKTLDRSAAPKTRRKCTRKPAGIPAQVPFAGLPVGISPHETPGQQLNPHHHPGIGRADQNSIRVGEMGCRGATIDILLGPVPHGAQALDSKQPAGGGFHRDQPQFLLFLIEDKQAITQGQGCPQKQAFRKFAVGSTILATQSPQQFPGNQMVSLQAVLQDRVHHIGTVAGEGTAGSLHGPPHGKAIE